jgi:hypothetical protein
MEDKHKGLRKDPELYKQIISTWERSRDYIKDRRIFIEAERFQKVYDNDPWNAFPKMDRPEHLTKLKVPIAMDVIETGLSVATSQIPRPDIEPEIDPAKINEIIASLPQSEDQDENSVMNSIHKQASSFADGMTKELVKHWKHKNMQYVIREMYRKKGVAGTWFLKTWFDGEKKEELCDIQSIFPSPGVNSIPDHKTEAFIYAPIITARKAKLDFGIEELEPNALNSLGGLRKERNPETGVSHWMTQAMTVGRSVIDKLTGKSITEDNGFVMPIYCYMPANDDDFLEVKEEKPVVTDGEVKVNLEAGAVEKEEVVNRQDKFPSGYKCVTILFGHQDWIVSEEDCPYAPHGFPQPPFVRMAGYLPSDDFWGVSEIKQIGDLISQVCLSASNLSDVLRFTGNAPLIMPRDLRKNTDAKTEGENDAEDDALVAMPGEIWRTDGKVGFLSPPAVGFDVKWWIEWLMNMIDRVTHLSDAMRGFSQFSQESGRKVRELRAAALGTFAPKLDEVVEFVNEVYRMWSWIDIHMTPNEVILQKQEDEEGEANFSKFTPGVGQLYSFFISVSARALIPDDPEEKFNQVVTLYNLGMKRTGTPLVPPEMVVDCATAIEEKQRARKWLADNQKEEQEAQQKKMLFGQFQQIASKQVSPGSPEEEQAFTEMQKIFQALPEIANTPDFKALPPRLKGALAADWAKNVIQGGADGTAQRTGQA